MSIVDRIKEEAKRSGTSKRKFTYFREGQKQRVRFLNEMDEGIEIDFHDSYEKNINVPCQEAIGKSYCPYCEDTELKTRTQYAWSVWNYETGEVQIFMFRVNNCSPVPALLAMWENYGTIMDRDYVISQSGSRADKTFSVVPMDKAKFRNTKAKAMSEQAILKAIAKAFPADDSEDEEEEAPKPRGKKKPAGNKKPVKKPVEDDTDDDDDYDDEWSEEEEKEYDKMTAKELYQECKKRELEVRPKKPQQYYIKMLEEDDDANDDWSDGDDEEDWEDD